jgi:hypothetical protein
VIIGTLVGLTAGLYVALNLLGAGGGRPNSASTVQIVNATLCAVWFFSYVFAIARRLKMSRLSLNLPPSASFGGTVLNKVGPAITASLGVMGYILYVGSLWYFDQVGKPAFPIFAGVCIGVNHSIHKLTSGGTEYF